MNDLDRLKLLLTTLNQFTATDAKGLGRLASEIEFIWSSISEKPQDINSKYFALWDALEIIAVLHQEAGTSPTDMELSDVDRMISDLKKSIENIVL